MIFVFDLFEGEIFENKTFLFNKTLCSFIEKGFPGRRLLFIYNEQKSDYKGTDSKKNIFYYIKTGNLLTKIKAKKAFQKRLRQIKPAVLLSSRFLKTPGNIPLVLYIGHVKQLKNISAKQLSLVAGILVSSRPVKQFLISGMNVPETKIFIAPFVPDVIFQPVEWEQREIIKKEITGGHEYFFINHTASAGNCFINLLRSFSFFKKRLQSNMKLVVAGEAPLKDKAVSDLLAAYKYRGDVVFTGNHVSSEQKAGIVASAYAVLQLAIETDEWVLPQEALQCKVPVLMCQPGYFSQQEGLFVYADADNVDDMAYKMMLLYKDETYRNKIISNAQQQLSAFSAGTSAEKIMQCLLYAAANEGAQL
ncbi:MAG: glycosyltransferase [Chitinophagaceae bacterium]|nr:glycosyltransferase [Chitinophagaceae bacterium]